MIWLPATLLAALLQSWRTALQQRMRSELSLNTAGLARFLFGLPVALTLFGVYTLLVHASFPPITKGLLIAAAFGGLCQIFGTNLLLMAFGYRNYLVGNAYAKTEAIQGALLSWVLLHEFLHPLAWLGIFVSVVGVFILSLGDQRPSVRQFLSMITQPAALCGLGAGFAFAVTALSVKYAAAQVGTPDIVLNALTTLVVTMCFQVVMQGSYVLLREPEQLRRLLREWRTTGQVGLLSAMGSACLFLGFASGPVALVRTIAQIEVIFSLMFSRFFLKEKLRRPEIMGLLIVTAGVVLSLAGGFLKPH